jgi:hypothetical protein
MTARLGKRARITSLSVVTRLLAGQLHIQGGISGRGETSSLLQCVQTSSGAHAASYSVGTLALSLVVKRPVPEAYHLPMYLYGTLLN